MPIARTSLIDSVVEELTAKIASGELKDGDVLASQDELARSMGVSRSSLREALNRLCTMGLVEVRHGSGTYIRSASPVRFMESLTPLLVMDPVSPSELVVAQGCLEAAVAELAARNATDEDLAELERLLDAMRSSADAREYESFIEHDLEFHRAIATASQNHILIRVLEIIREIFRQFIYRSFARFSADAPITLEQHARIYGAIRDHDPEAARRHMDAHIAFLKKIGKGRELHTS